MKNNEEIIKILLEKYPGKRIPCPEARQLAADLAIEPGQMGSICDEAGIRIVACELGCF